MRKTFQYKTKINKYTEKNCLHQLDLCRKLYNLGLEQKILLWKQFKIGISCYTQYNQLPELKNEYLEYKQINAQCLQDVLDRLDKAYQSFFRRIKNKKEKVGFPRFKGKNRFDSFTFSQTGWKLIGKYLYITNIGKFKLFFSRPIQGTIKTVTIKRTPTNEWFVTFSCDNVPENILPKTNNEIGIDVGIKSFCVDSDGLQITNPKFFKQSEKILRRKQKSLSRKKKGSNRRQKARILVAKTYNKITNQRKDFLHKTANYYIENYDTIFVENLKIENMIRNKCLSKSISNISWGTFFNLLSYKAEEAGKIIIKVNPNGTSQICSNCGEKVPKQLSVRIHNCPFCGLKIDRDLNASLNIKKVGQTFQALISPFDIA